jgi:phosphate transport system substrate-binding protein
LPQSVAVVQKVSLDPQAIGFAAAMRATASARVIPIAARTGDAPVAPTEENIVAGRYPLDRFLLVYAPRPLTPLAREFLRLMLSRDGQEAVAASPQRYLPLSARDAAAERSKLD